VTVTLKKFTNRDNDNNNCNKSKVIVRFKVIYRIDNQGCADDGGD
jgi:hypothetical protein